MSPHEHLLCALLRGESPRWPGGGAAEDIKEWLEAAQYHGVLPLLAVELTQSTRREGWPEQIMSSLRESARSHAMYELAHRAELGRVLDDLDRAGVKPLLLKGTGLAYSCYASPALRPRADTDMMVPPEAKDEASRLLKLTGYRRVSGPAGRFVGYQLEFRRVDRLGASHTIDLHWRISNSQYFAWLFEFDELATSAVPMQRLHPLARRVGNVHALIVSLLHRASNNRSLTIGFGERLIWHYDIHLIVGQMSNDELDLFLSLVEAKRVVAIAIDGVRSCLDRFNSPRLLALIDRLTRSPFAKSSGEFITERGLRYEWMEFCAIPRVRDRMSYLAQRAFPTNDYMRERFPDAAARPLPFLHAQRIVDGLGKVFTARGR